MAKEAELICDAVWFVYSYSEAMMKAQENPFVGVKAIEDKDRFFGREYELRRLTELLVAERIVLFYSPSGAGKTSLLKAGLVPKLKTRKFIVHPIMRVGKNIEWADGASAVGRNRYLKSALNDLGIAPPPPSPELSEKEFSDYIRELSHNGKGSQPEVFIFDQFEEILTRDPFDLDRKREFFDQVGKALQDQHRWAVFAMREDYIAGLDPYLHYVPTRLATTFRLNLLSRAAAIEAIQKTAEAVQKKEGLSSLPDNIPPVTSVEAGDQLSYFFSHAAASKLVDNLSEVLIPQAENAASGNGLPTQKIHGQYVEPVHLQVVCKRLWKSLPAQTSKITPKDIEEFGKVDASLEEYYSEEIKDVADETKAGEQREIREWFDRQLITPQGLRSQVRLNDVETQQLGTQTVSKLIDSYLVRSDKRHEITWLELAHDRLIKPVRDNNKRWFEEKLKPLERRAQAWDAEKHPSSLLFVGAEWEAARKWAEGKKLNEREKDFYAACEKAANDEQLKKRQERRIDQLRRNLWVVSLIFGAIAVIAIFAIVSAREQQRKASVVEEKAATAEKKAKSEQLAAIEARNKARIDSEKAASDTATAEKATSEAAIKTRNAATAEANAHLRTLEAKDKTEKARQISLEANAKMAKAIEEATLAKQNEEAASQKLLDAETNYKTRIALADIEAGEKIRDAKMEAALLKALAESDKKGADAWDMLFGDGDPKAAVGLLLDAIGMLHQYDSTSDKYAAKKDLLNIAQNEVKKRLPIRLEELYKYLPSTLLDATISDCRKNEPGCKPGDIQSLGFSEDGQWLVTASDNGKVYKYNLAYRHTPDNVNFQRQIPILYQNEVSQVAVSPNTGHIAVGYLSGDIKIWNLNDHGIPISAFRYPIHQLMFLGDGGMLASASKFWTYSVGELTLSDSPKAKRLYTKPGLLDWVWGVWIKARTTRQVNDFAFISKTGFPTLLMVAREDGQLEIREARSGKEVLTISLFANLEQRKRDRGKVTKSVSGDERKDVFLHIATSPDGNLLATAGRDGNIYVWDTKNLWNKRNAQISFNRTLIGAGAVQSLAFNSESNLLASVGQDGAVHLWDVKNNWVELFSSPLISHTGTINTVVFNTDPQHQILRLATADSKGITKIWHIPSSEKRNELRDLQDQIRDLQYRIRLSKNNSANVNLDSLLENVRQFIK